MNTGLISVKLINGIKSDEDQQYETASVNRRCHKMNNNLGIFLNMANERSNTIKTCIFDMLENESVLRNIFYDVDSKFRREWLNNERSS